MKYIRRVKLDIPIEQKLFTLKKGSGGKVGILLSVCKKNLWIFFEQSKIGFQL